MKYIKELLKWIWDGKLLYLFLILFGFIFLLNEINIGLETEFNIRIYGLILQLFGAISIIYLLKDKLFLFQKHGLTKFLKDYFKRLPRYVIRKNVNIKAESASHTLTVGKARVINNPKEDLKDIIRYFNEEIQYLHKSLMETRNDYTNEIKQLKKEIKYLNNALNIKIEETTELIKVSSTSNIPVELFGIGCIILGLILATIPDLINTFLF